MLERFAGTAVVDSKGRFLGVIPGTMGLEGDFTLANFPSPDHKTVYVKEVPKVWLGCLEYLEDRHRRSWWRSKGGVDAPAFVRGAVASVLSGSVQGGSTLPMQLLRSLHHRPADPEEPLSFKVKRKIVEVLQSPVLVNRMSAAPGIQNLDRAIAMHLPLAIGAEDVTIALHEVQARFAPIATKLNSLAAYSEVTADLEIANGGTCGDRSGPQTGPRARQRQLDARLFRDAAVHVRGLSDRLDTAISALRAVEGDALGALQNQLRDSYQQVRVVRNDPELPTIFERLVRRRDLGRTGFPEGFTCPDGYLDTLIDEVVQAKVPDLPPPPTFFGGSRSDILNLVLSRQVAMFSSFFRGLTSLQPSTRNELVETRRDLILAGSPVFADSAVGKDMLPFAAAVVIDLLILIAGLLYQPMTGEDFNRNFAAMSEGTKLSPKSEKDKEVPLTNVCKESKSSPRLNCVESATCESQQ